jgi:glycosyltransferase involved in cell wall biosynthesis
VLPSYREGTPRTLLEAACLSKPIVTTDVPGCHQVVTDGYNGFLCKVKDAHDLASKMELMINCSDIQLKTMGENGRKKIESEFDEQIVFSKYLISLRNLSTQPKATNKIKEKIVISRN